MNKCSVIAGLLLASHVCMAATIESGTVQVTGMTGLMSFTIHGDGFSVSGVGSNFTYYIGQPAQPGGIVNGNWGLVGNDFLGGSATVGGVTFPRLSFGDLDAAGWTAFRFLTPPVTVMGPGLHETAFSFSGQVCGTTPFVVYPYAHPCVVDLRELTGYGVATLLFEQSHPSDPTVWMRQMTYTFTPEPSTFGMVLACLGLLTAVSLRWHR